MELRAIPRAAAGAAFGLALGELAVRLPALGATAGALGLCLAAWRARRGELAWEPLLAALGSVALGALLPALALSRDPYHALAPSRALALLWTGLAVVGGALGGFAVVAGAPPKRLPPARREGPSPEPAPPLLQAALVATGLFLPLSIAGMQIAIGATAALLLVSIARGARPRLSSALDGPFFALAAAALGSALLSGAPRAALSQTAFWTLLSYFAMSRAAALSPPRTLRWALAAWAGAAAFAGLLALCQHWTGFDLVAALGLRAPIRVEQPRHPGRFAGTGSFNSRLTLAHVLLLGAAMELGRRLAGDLGGARPRLAALAAWLLGVWSSFARAAWMALAALLGAAGGASLLRWDRRRAAGLGAAALVGGLLWIGAPGARGWAAAGLQPAKNSDRLFLWARGAEMALDHPVAGIGFGRYQERLGPYYDRWDKGFFMRTWSHDLFLSLLVECGPLGLFAYLWLLAAAGSEALAAWRRRHESGVAWPVGLCLGGGLAALAFAIVGTFHDALYDGEVAYNLAFALSLAASAASALGRPGTRAPATAAAG